MRSSMIRLAATLVFTVTLAPCVVSIPVAHAQEPVPDVRGNYELYGTQTVTGCGEFGGDFSSPLAGTLQITAQDGDRISGTFGFPDQGATFFSLTGTVGVDGSFEGTWSYSQAPGGVFSNERVIGTIANGAADADFTATYGAGGIACNYRASLASIAATLAWQAPDPASLAALPPPRALTLSESTAKRPETRIDEAVSTASGFPPDMAERAAKVLGGSVTGYKVYRSSTPNVQTVAANLFAQVPPTQTNLPTGAAAGGSFFVVTSTYEEGESDPSNEVSGGLTPASLTRVKVTNAKIKATGNGFSTSVQVYIDGIPFVSIATVKNGKKVTQKGALLSGQTLSQYLTPGKVVAITFRNADGAIATYVYTKP